MSRLSAATVQSLRQDVDTACADGEKGISGTTVVVVGKDGGELFAHAGGKRGVESKEPMTLDSIYWIASCTKMICGLACMQLVEQGKLTLDDPEFVEKHCPELKAVKVLEDDGTLVDKKRGITLRMLLTHTSGFGYTFFNTKIRDYSKPISYDEFSGHIYDITQPLLHQPGERWEYGVGVDWAGILLERVTGMSLNDYMQMHIFEPLGLENISMFPTESMKANLAHFQFRNADGTLSPYDHVNRRPLIVTSEAEKKICLNSGGAGCFANPREYCQILAVLLNDGISPKTGAQLLQKRTVDEMFRNQIPHLPDFARQIIPASKKWMTNPIPDLHPAHDGEQQGFGLSFMLTGSATGRSAGSAYWAGLSNCFWWCDRQKGIAGMVTSQIFPFGDMNVIGLWAGIEIAVNGELAP
ncbi:hypothetical protein OIDMADRAFT_123708 [Oidiodendron maius Zn]|uniref:Beta-lactamase-related domain-containing protein n=1 Tax=Oidiodendron maius (strain Zn) TaxID=913774 RepID=A0A0C3DGM1_OIDMZ|nr:hypothetical protein OIDMADRAFT_123708 [Oidiodendron maius Zn]